MAPELRSNEFQHEQAKLVSPFLAYPAPAARWGCADGRFWSDRAGRQRRPPFTHRKRMLAKLVRERRPGIVVNEHYEANGGIRVSACLQARLRGYRIEAQRVAL